MPSTRQIDNIIGSIRAIWYSQMNTSFGTLMENLLFGNRKPREVTDEEIEHLLRVWDPDKE